MKLFGFEIKRQSNTQKNDERKFHRFNNRGSYNVVDGFSQSQIAPSSSEPRTEDEVLTPSHRAKLLDLSRNLVRNSSLYNTILGQLTTNVVSSCGGKVILNFTNEEINKNLKKYFSQFTRNADFFTCDTYNKLLKRALREYIIGGGCVLIFDNGLVEDSGKVLLFESESIVNTTPEAIQKHYGKGAYQSQGKVYNSNGRHIGTVVSRSERNKTTADPKKCFFLKKDPNENPIESNWIHFDSNWREGRGVSQAASAISTIHQLEDLVSSELMASRRNSQIFCWLTQNKQVNEDEPSTFDYGVDIENMSDEEIEKIAQSEESSTKTISFNKARENSVVYESLPEGFDAKQLQTQHPNSNVEAMVDWLANRCASTLGLSKIFATGNPEDSNWRANQLFTYPTILEFQKSLEQVCDWTFRNFVKWCIKKNLIDSSILNDEDFDSKVSWSWKGIDTLDPVSNENANEKKLRNMTSNYREILGQDWKEKLKQTAEEMKWLKENNLPVPQYFLKSGGEATGADKETKTITQI